MHGDWSTGAEELLFVSRERQAAATLTHDYTLLIADPRSRLEELARVAEAAHGVDAAYRGRQGRRDWPTTR